MSLPFTLLHSLPERTRIRWAGDANDRPKVGEIADLIDGIPGILRTDARSATGSIVIEHEHADSDDLQRWLRDGAAIELALPRPTRPQTGLETIQRSYRLLDERLGKADIDLNSSAFLLLLSLAAVQALRGNLGGSAVSLLWYAISIANRTRPSSQPPARTAELRPT